MKYSYSHIVVLAVIIALTSCQKYLEAKPTKSLTTIETPLDLQSLLDDYNAVNYSDANSEAGTDNYYLTPDNYNNLTLADRNLYIWSPSDCYLAPVTGSSDWLNVYASVYRANTILDNIDKVNFDGMGGNSTYADIKGQSLFLRARCFFSIATNWALGYDSSTAQSIPGIPLKLTSNFNEKLTRASLQQTYDRIINDLKTSIQLLPNTPLHVVRPSKIAAMGLLARVYLTTGDFKSCWAYTDSCLRQRSSLLDFNTLDTTSPNPFPTFHTEIIYQSATPFNSGTYNGYVDSLVIGSYDPSDLRRPTFYYNRGDGTYWPNGGYSNYGMFDGIATDELYLMRAECSVRLGKIQPAIDDINTLLKTRYITGTYVSKVATTVSQALNIVLTERRKELTFRNLRWMDIKRLNRISPDISLKRIIDQTTYNLPANSKRFANPLPEDIVTISGIAQNSY